MVYEDPNRGKNGDAWKWTSEIGALRDTDDHSTRQGHGVTGRSSALAFLIALGAIVVVVLAILILPGLVSD